jgi:hypothetical protein
MSAEALAPGFEMIDHRTLALHNLRGAAAMRDYFAAMADLEQAAVRFNDMRCLPAAMLVRYTHSWVARASGGAFERQLYMLWQTDDDGSICRSDLFDVEQEAETLACRRRRGARGRFGVDARLQRCTARRRTSR